MLELQDCCDKSNWVKVKQLLNSDWRKTADRVEQAHPLIEEAERLLPMHEHALEPKSKSGQVKSNKALRAMATWLCEHRTSPWSYGEAKYSYKMAPNISSELMQKVPRATLVSFHDDLKQTRR